MHDSTGFCQDPKVSVLIPSYNRAYIVRDAIQSAMNQTYQRFEIVVVDDGSTDNTRELISSLGIDRLRYIRHEENRGCSCAYNTALNAATGDTVAFLDSDDIWRPDYLRRLMDVLLKHPEVAAVFSDTELVQRDRRIPSLMSLMTKFPDVLRERSKSDYYVLTPREMYLCLLEEVPIKPSAVIVRREVFTHIGGFNEAWPSGTDWDLFLRMSKHYAFAYVDTALVIQTAGEDSTFRNNQIKDKEFLITVFSAEKAQCGCDAQARKAITRGLSQHYWTLAGLHLYSSRHVRAALIYFRGYRSSRSAKMLFGAITSALPLSWRERGKQMLRKGANIGW